LKLFSFFLFIVVFSFSIYSAEIATFKLSYIIDNSLEFKKFFDKLDSLRTKLENELIEDENILISKKNKIEESKMIFSETEYSQQIENYNKLTSLFKGKLEDFNNHINMNIEKNKNILIDEIIEITKELSQSNKIDIILNEDQYFLSSEKIDISDKIIEILNKKQLDLKVIQLP